MKTLVIIFTLLIALTWNVSAQLHFVKTVTITDTTEGGSARPEIVATSEKVFVLYLGDITAGANRTFKVRIYNGDLDTIVTSKVLVSRTPEYGSPTDIRVASDGEYLYAFYETNKPSSTTTAVTYLWAAKYKMNDNFDRVAYTPVPITNSKPMEELQDSGELVDDPAPLVGTTSVFVVTRLKYSLAMAGKTIYRVREFSKYDLTKVSEFDLDLSGAPGIDGRGRICSLIYFNEHYYVALPTTVSDNGIVEAVDPSAISNIALVKLDTNWTFNSQTDVKIISAEPNDKEFYVSGLSADGKYFYATYVQIASGSHMAILKIFDMNLNLVQKLVVRSIVAQPAGGEIRPSFGIWGNRVFSGQSAGESLGKGNAEIVLYEKIITSVEDDELTPNKFSLFQNYPNPFNPSTTIRFSLTPSLSQWERVSEGRLPAGEAGVRVTLNVFDVLGREVTRLVDGELSTGEHSVVFNAMNLPSGVYLYRLRADEFTQEQKMILLK